MSRMMSSEFGFPQKSDRHGRKLGVKMAVIKVILEAYIDVPVQFFAGQ